MRVALAGTRPRLARRLQRAGFDVTEISSEVRQFDAETSHWTIGPVTAQVLVTGFPTAGPNVIAMPGKGFLAERYVIACLRMMVRQDARQIERRRGKPSRWHQPNPYDFVLTPYEGDVDDTHRGPAVLTADGADIDVEIHLMGHLQPIDGSYRWFGRITAHPAVTELHRSGRQDVTLRLPGGPETKARLAELDPWGNTRITGSGRPPFPYP